MLRLFCWVLGLAALTGCDIVHSTPTLPPEVSHSIEVRLNLGLRAEPEWVLAVDSDPNAVVRDGIKVTVEEAASLDAARLQDAIELRAQFGLVVEPDWVRAVLTDPASVERGPGILMSPQEAAAWDSRVESRSEIRQAFFRYAFSQPEEWAGWYFDEDGIAVALVTGHLQDHLAAIGALIAPEAGRVDVRLVEWTLAELEEFVASVEADRPWFDDQSLQVTTIEADIKTNSVLVEVEARHDVPGLVDSVRLRLGAGTWLTLHVTSDATADLPLGRLTVTVRDVGGQPISGVWCEAIPDIPGAAGDNTFRDTNDEGVCRWGNDALLKATTYTINVRVRVGAPVLGSRRIDVIGGGDAVMEILTLRP